MGQKNSAGKYRGRVQIGIDKDGKPINKYVSASTQRELEQKKAEIRHCYVDGQPRQKDRLFYEYAAEWYELKNSLSSAWPASAAIRWPSTSMCCRLSATAIYALSLPLRSRSSSTLSRIPANPRSPWLLAS